MSKITSQKISDGNIQAKPQSNTQKHRKKPTRSNITSKMRTRRSEVVNPCDIQSEDDEGDGANEEHDNATEDPDVFALPGAQSRPGGETGKRLAGRRLKQSKQYDTVDTVDTTDLMEDDQAVEGADGETKMYHDDNYDDVENISEEDEVGKPGEEEDSDDSNEVLQAAEQELIDEFELEETRNIAHHMDIISLKESQAIARQLSLQDSVSLNDGLGDPIDLAEDPFYGFDRDGGTYGNMWDEAEKGLWRMPETLRNRESSDPASATQKRVRFEEVEVDESSASDSEDPNEAYPDLLDAADVPGLKSRIARGFELDARLDRNDFNDAESFYDFEDDDERLAFQIDEASDSDDDMSSSDSDDDGDTTDEESREEQIARMEKIRQASGKASNVTKQRLPIRNAAPTPSTPSTSRPTTPKGSSKALKLGTFALDPTRATMHSASDGKKIKLLPPATPLEKDKAFWERAKTANSSRDGSPGNSYLTRPAPEADSMPDRPFTTESTLGSMFQGNLGILRNNDVAGIVDDNTADEVFPAFVNTQTSFMPTTTMEDSDTDMQDDINIQDFIELSDSGSDTDEQQMGVCTPTTDANWYDSDMAMNTPGRRGSDLMDHFDQFHGIVGSFRRNQHQAKHVSSLASHPAKRASAHEYNALQKGRRGAANTPITPARKKRISQDLTPFSAGIRKTLNSPLSARRPRSRGNSIGGMNTNRLSQTLAGNPFDQA